MNGQTEAGGKVDAPLRCGTLRAIVAAGGGVWMAGAEGGDGRERIRYSVPEYATGEVRAYLSGLAEVAGPDQGTARLAAGRVYGAGVVLSADGTVLARDVSADFGKGAEEHWLLGAGRLRAPEVLTGATAVVAVNRGAGYCHWLLEELPRLLTVRPGEVDNVIAHAAGSWAREAWRRRGGRERWVEAKRSGHFQAAPLVVPGLVAEAGAPTPQARGLVREFAGHGASQGAGEKIYVSRAKAARRRVANEVEVWRELEGRGFSRVYLENLSWAGQVATMRAARLVVGAHGAGLANLVFCEPGVRVVELINRAYFNPTFWRLSSLGRLDYRPLVSRANDAGDFIREDSGRGRDSVVVDIAALRAALDAV